MRSLNSTRVLVETRIPEDIYHEIQQFCSDNNIFDHEFYLHAIIHYMRIKRQNKPLVSY